MSAGSLEEAKAVIESDQQIDLLFTDVALSTDTDGGFELVVNLLLIQGRYRSSTRADVMLTDGMRALLVAPRAFSQSPIPIQR